MKKLSIHEQVEAAKKEVGTWPPSILSLMSVDRSRFFRNVKKEEIQVSDQKMKAKDSIKE